MRKHLSWYAKSVRGASAFRAKLFKITDVATLKAHVLTLGADMHRPACQGVASDFSSSLNNS